MSRPLVLLVEYMFLVAATVGRCSERARERERESFSHPNTCKTLAGMMPGGLDRPLCPGERERERCSYFCSVEQSGTICKVGEL